MDRNRNWQGWAALALAGLALVVALGGRGPFGFRGQDRFVSVESVPAAPVAPAAPQAPGFGRGVPPEAAAEMERHMAEMQGRMAEAQSRMAQAHGRFGHDGPMMMGRGFDHGRGGPFGFFPLFGLLRGLVNLAALGLLGFVLFTVWRQRRAPAAAASGPAPTTPAGHDPRVE
jgi:hypothetical protein